MVSQTSNATPSTLGPAWEIARLFPNQGTWTEADYLDLTQELNKLVEFTHGRIEVLEMPKEHHQLVVAFLMGQLNAYVRPQKLGKVMFSPFRVRLGEGLFREPDVTFMHRDHRERAHDDFWDGADLMMEVVSPDPQSCS